MKNIAIRVENLSKQYVIGANKQKYDTFRDAFAQTIKRGLYWNGRGSIKDNFWALCDVNFDIKQGEVVGIIGRNGAGKSTLLKILSRITEPTIGRATIYGRMSSLLEVGTGFHPELTGRENIYLNGAILGMRKEEIVRKFDEIVTFAEISAFLDTPVKHYSSGMYVRLAFAVAAHLEPEILIVDEVLAVGDIAFQRKCFGKMKEVSKTGRTILLVSHNMTAILNMCQRGIFLERGKVACQGEAKEVVSRYMATTEDTHMTFCPGEEVAGNRAARIENFYVDPDKPCTGKPLVFCFTISRPVGNRSELMVEVAVSMTTEDGSRLFQLYSRHMGKEFLLAPGRTEIRTRIDSLPLVPGFYRLNLWLGSGSTPIHWLKDCYTLTVQPGYFEGGEYVDSRGYPFIMPASWTSAPVQCSDLPEQSGISL
jgi:lipopolysaccharide transport system ATP-binding protein